MKNEKGNILVTVILMMVILIIIAGAITSIGNIKLESSIDTKTGLENTEKLETLGEMIKNGTNWGLGIDKWILDSVISNDILGKNKLVLKIFVDKASKNIDFYLENLTSPSSIYIVALKKNISGFSITANSIPNGVTLNSVGVKDPTSSLAWEIAPFKPGNYKLSINNSSSDEYIVFIRVFSKE